MRLCSYFITYPIKKAILSCYCCCMLILKQKKMKVGIWLLNLALDIICLWYKHASRAWLLKMLLTLKVIECETILQVWQTFINVRRVRLLRCSEFSKIIFRFLLCNLMTSKARWCTSCALYIKLLFLYAFFGRVVSYKRYFRARAFEMRSPCHIQVFNDSKMFCLMLIIQML